MNQLRTIEIWTPRLLLRPFRAEDAPAMYRNWAGDPEVSAYLTRPHFPSEAAVAERLAEWAAETGDPEVCRWAIELRELGEPIGYLVAVPQEKTESAELGWCIGRAWWGRGIVPEAAAAVVDHLFRSAGLRRVEARCDTRNSNSGRVMQKLGMSQEGVLRRAGRCNAGTGDLAVYAVLAEEWENRRRSVERTPLAHKGTVTIETERLLLRSFRADDAPAMWRNWVTDGEVTRFLTWQPHTDIALTEQLAALWARETAQKLDCYQWAVVPKDLGEPIGSLSVVRAAEQVGEAELGYCIGRAWWGRGYMPEAVRAVIAYLIRDVGFHRVSARHDTRNPKSGRVMQKAGMRFEGVLRAAGLGNAGLCDLAVYSVLAEDLN